MNPNNNKSQENPFVLVIMSVVAILLGFSGVDRLFNNDFLIGIPQVILGFVAGTLGFKQYWKTKKRGGSPHAPRKASVLQRKSTTNFNRAKHKKPGF
ncbi:hypothetical protein [Bacillus sp. AK128]